MTVTGDAAHASSVRTPRRSPTPVLVAVGAAVAFAVVAMPLAGLVARASWSTIAADLSSPAVRSALWLSLACSTAAAALSFLVGVPLAWVLARIRFPGRALVRGVVLLPLVLPPVVGGVALLGAFGRNGVVGAPLYGATGIQLTFSTAGVVLAQTFAALPFLVLTVEAGLRSIDRHVEDVAATLGAPPGDVARRVTLPLLTPALVAGVVLAWARALGEFGATITFAGNVAGRTRTLPLEVYLLVDRDPDVAAALSLVLLAVALVVIVALRDRWFPRTS